jgi:hypothetical protein
VRIHRTLFGIGIFLFGCGFAVADVISAPSTTDEGSVFAVAVILFAAASIVLGWSVAEEKK